MDEQLIAGLGLESSFAMKGAEKHLGSAEDCKDAASMTKFRTRL